MKPYLVDLPVGNKKPVFIDGVRTPFVKSFGVFEDCDSLELFSRVVAELVRRTEVDAHEINEISCGVVIPQTKNANVGRDAIINLGLPPSIHGYTLTRACASSLQTVADAARTIMTGGARLILAGGVEVLSDVPIVYTAKARKALVKLSKSKSATEKLSLIKDFLASALTPKPPALAEPLTGLTMGESAEIMVKKNSVSREEQDQLAFRSHQNAAKAMAAGKFDEEVVPIWPAPKFNTAVKADNIVRVDTTLEALAKLKPAFDKRYGTITAGNSSPLTDGAAVTLIADELHAKNLGLKPKTAIKDMLFLGVDPTDQLLIGPAIGIPMILMRNKLSIDDIANFEIHEAFAGQVLSCLKSMESAEFCKKYLGLSKAFGTIPVEKLNVNGGAVAIGHPFGATGARLITTLSNELVRTGKKYGVIGVCAAGGLAGVMLLEQIAA